MGTDSKEVRGNVVDSYGFVRIVRGFPYNFYELSSPSLSEAEQRLSDDLIQAISGKIPLLSLDRRSSVFSGEFVEAFSKGVLADINAVSGPERIPSPLELKRFSDSLAVLLAKFFPQFANSPFVANSVISNSVGFGKLSGLLSDNELEEIMVNGVGRPVFVFHRRHGMCKTNVVFLDSKSLEVLSNRIAKSANKPFDESFPLLNARLPDGNRVNSTFVSVSPAGTSMTIRKFSRANFSVVDLILRRTISSELAAFFWVMVEGLGIQPMNLIVTGGTGSGKTTTLNCLASFIPAAQRIVSIEDTLELDLGERDNWVQLESRPRSRSGDAVTMEDLLQNALRMRPDRLVVGEVRGIEAQTLFVAMDTGHDGTMGTVHANTAKEMLLRLKSPPMSVSESMQGLLDLVIVQYRMFVPNQGLVRRVAQVSEISQMEEKPLLATLYEWNRKTDSIVRTDTPSHVLQVLSERTSMTVTEIRKEMQVRKLILEWLVENNVVDHSDVHSVIQEYYLNPKKVLESVLKSRKQD